MNDDNASPKRTRRYVPEQAREVEKRRHARNREAGLVRVYNQWVHKSKRARFTKSIRAVVESEDWKTPENSHE